MLAWKTNKRIKYLLFPLALFYWGIVYWRNFFYSMGFFISKKLPTKVISVGNITIGGTGKTPAVIFLTKTLSTASPNFIINPQYLILVATPYEHYRSGFFRHLNS